MNVETPPLIGRPDPGADNQAEDFGGAPASGRPLERIVISSASRRLRSQARVDAFTLKACIDSLQRQLVNIQILTATFQAETQSLAQQFDSM